MNFGLSKLVMDYIKIICNVLFIALIFFRDIFLLYLYFNCVMSCGLGFFILKLTFYSFCQNKNSFTMKQGEQPFQKRKINEQSMSCKNENTPIQNNKNYNIRLKQTILFEFMSIFHKKGFYIRLAEITLQHSLTLK